MSRSHPVVRTAVAVCVLATVLSGTSAAPASASPAREREKLCGDRSDRAERLPRGVLRQCAASLRRIADGTSTSPRKACGRLSRKHPQDAGISPFAACVAAGKGLLRAGNGIDLAFLTGMIPHHESAVGMARAAQARGESQFVKDLANDIIAAQQSEIATMSSIVSRLDALGVKARSLGLSQSEMGMDHDASHLDGAQPFDPVFIDMMIPHHLGAIRMSQVVLARGTGRRTRNLALAIVDAQTREIEAMQRFRSATVTPGAEQPPPGYHPH